VAVNLNGQPPIHAYARTCSESHIKLTSIDHGVSVTIRDLEELHQYRTDGFGLAKAALVLSGFSTDTGTWPRGVTTLEQILEHFGGGIELTTLAAIPSGSGLGTSSIMAAVLVAVLARLTGRELTQRELFNRVLQLEQELTTGGGWQDQIGGCVGGTKLITTRPGLVPDPMIHFVPSDLIDPNKNGGRTLLFYTGIRRLAKNILHEVVGRYLDRNRETLATYRNLQALPHQLADALSRRDMPAFGKLIGESWKLNKELDPNSTTPEIESLLDQLHPHIQGAKLLGAGGGGFLALVCSSPESLQNARRILNGVEINDRRRFFDYSISQTGLELSVC
jgi:galactokinase/mevalonate kinase-like predicted kinase